VEGVERGYILQRITSTWTPAGSGADRKQEIREKKTWD